MFEIYQEIEPDLIIESSSRDKLSIEKQQKEIEDLEKKNERIEKLEKKLADYEQVMTYIRQNRLEKEKKTKKPKENKRWLRPVGEPFSGR